MTTKECLTEDTQYPGLVPATVAIPAVVAAMEDPMVMDRSPLMQDQRGVMGAPEVAVEAPPTISQAEVPLLIPHLTENFSLRTEASAFVT